MSAIKDLIKRRKVWVVIVLLLADALFFSLTNPSSVSSVVLIVAFALLLVTLYVLLELGITGIGLYIPGLKQQRRRLAFALTIVLGILLALQSTGQLSSRDALVIIPLGIVLYIYLTYFRPRPARR